MSLVRGLHYRLIVLLISAGMPLVILEPASAQLSIQEKQRIASTIAAEINRAIDQHQKERVALREKVISRLIQCGSLFATMAKQLDDPEAKKRIQDVVEAKERIQDVAAISYDLSARVSEGVTLNRFKEIGNAAQKFIKEKFAAKRTRDSEREMDMLFINCKSFHQLETVSGAVAALLPPETQQNAAAKNAAAIHFANELQECSLYYMLLAVDLISQVPKNSGPLSPADNNKAVHAWCT